MNGLSLSILTMIHYESCVRDTLEYCLNAKTDFKLEAYNHKKRALKIEVEEQTPLKNFLDNNEKAKEQILPLIEKINTEIYGPESTILTLNKEATELRVDKAQHLAIYEVVLPLRLEISRAIRAHINYATQQNKLEQQIVDLMNVDEEMFCAVALRTLFEDLQIQFQEFNKAKQEAKGADTPQSNFIQNDITRIVKLIHMVRDTSMCRTTEYWNALDQVCKVIELSRGRREMPSGRTFAQEFTLTFELINPFLKNAEASWRSLFTPAIQELQATAQKNNGKINVKDEGPLTDEKKN